MASLHKTVRDLDRYRRRWEALQRANVSSRAAAAGGAARFRELADFGPNPGDLRMLAHLPAQPDAPPALVVVLHGCTQTAASYDHGTGWSRLAEQNNFALLLPEQSTTNNPNMCFNSFQPGDAARDVGEACSIARMIDRMVVRHGIDRRRVYITGLSAGGAMASVMLATYPELFAGGAILAGLPYGTARNVQEAFESMFNGRVRSTREWGGLVRSASTHRGPWPSISIWHGSADTTVKPVNADELAKQWSNVHGITTASSRMDAGPRCAHRVWENDRGAAMVEQFVVDGMAHGVPIDSRTATAGTIPGPYMLDVGISSTHRIAASWGLIEPSDMPHPDREEHSAQSVTDIIAQTLRSAGLLRR